MYGEDIYVTMKENRKALMGAGTIILLVLMIIFGGEEPEISAGEITMSTEKAQSEKPKEVHSGKIMGAEKANSAEKLADPFSIAHLTREEMEQAKLAAELKQQEDMKISSRQEKIQEPVQVEAAPQIKLQENKGIVLQGIVKGRNGRMAILKQGDRSVTAAAGESIGGHTLTEIRDSEVILDNGEILELQLQ